MSVQSVATTSVAETGSVRAQRLLDHFEEVYTHFEVIIPNSEKDNPLLTLSQ